MLSPRPWWPVLPAIALALVTTAWTVRSAMAISGGALVYGGDDVYIEMALARTLALHGVWGVTPDAFAGVGTSLAWPLLLAAAFRVTVSDWWPLILAATASLGVLLAAAGVLRRHLSPSNQSAVLLVVSGGVSLSALTMLGMEHPLQIAVALVMAGTAARVLGARAEVSHRALLSLTALAAIVVAARYDTGALALGIVLLAVIHRQWRVAVCVTAGALLPVVTYAVVAVLHDWPIVPVTLAKSGLAQVGPAGLSWQVAVRGPLAALWHAPYLLALIAAAVARLTRQFVGRGFSRADSEASSPRERVILLWLFLMVAGAQVAFGRPALYGDYRYDAWVVALGIVAIGADGLAAGWPRRVTGRMAVAVVVMALSLHGVTLVRQSLRNVRLHFTWVRQVALFLRDSALPPYPAVHELGATSWLTGRPVLDLDGLATAEVRVALWDGDWTDVRFEMLASALGTRVAIAYGTPDEPFPVTWRRVGEWRTEGRLMFAFLAADSEAAAALRAALAAYDNRLPAGVTRVDLEW